MKAPTRAALVALLLGLCACSSPSSGKSAASALARSSSSPSTATTPHLVMDDARAGWAVWPSGKSWVLLHTTDGWQHVANATPIAVPTGGGLVVATAGGKIAVAIGAYDRLTQSPTLTGDGTAANWSTAELPGAIVNSRNAVALSGADTTAVLTTKQGGTVVRATPSGGWTTLTDASKLAAADALRLDAVTWVDALRGWLTGHGRAGTTVAFRTADGGHTWQQVGPASGSAVAAFAPCGAGQVWLLPVVTADGNVQLARTTDGGATWTTGATLTLASTSPVWGCHGDDVWFDAQAAHAMHVFSSTDGGATWNDRGAAPAGLTDLTPVGGGDGFAASRTSKSQQLWSVTGDATHFSAMALPGWVATLSGQTSTS